MTMLNYKKAVNEGMRTAIKQILIELCANKIGNNQIYIKFRLSTAHLKQMPKLIPDYAVFFTLDISEGSFKNLQVFNDYFEIEISSSFEDDDIASISNFVKIQVSFASVVHLIDTEQNVSIEIEEDENLEKSMLQKYNVS